MKRILIFIIPLLLLFNCKTNNTKSDAYGNFEADEIIIASETQGKLLTFEIKEGDILKAGQIVGYIDTIQYYLKYKQLLAQKKAIEAKIAGIKAQKEVQEQILSNLRNDEKRILLLHKDAAATDKQVDDITGQIKVTIKQIESISTQLLTTNSEIESIETQILIAKDQLNRCKIINPIDGTVLVKYANNFELIMPGKNLYKIANLKNMILRAYITGTQLPQVKIGQTVDVFIDKNKNEKIKFSGIILWISDNAEFTPKIIQTKEERANLVYAIKVLVENDGTLKIGMPGEIIF